MKEASASGYFGEIQVGHERTGYRRPEKGPRLCDDVGEKNPAGRRAFSYTSLPALVKR